MTRIMRSFRFLHMADVHLDTPFKSRDDSLRKRLRAASREAFARAVDVALETKVDAVLIAGDLFDGERISFATERFLLSEAARLCEAGIPLFYACGNHDPGGMVGKARTMRWPENVISFTEPNPRSHLLRTADGHPLAVISGAGHATAREGDNLAVRFASPRWDETSTLERAATSIPDRSLRLPHVALLHAWVQEAGGGDGHDRYAPATVDDLAAASRASGIHYWALGHIHMRGELAIPGPTPTTAYYPGNLQGRHFRETGAKGALLVNLHPDGHADVHFRPLAPLVWEVVTLDDLAAVNDRAELEERAIAACRDIIEESGLAASNWLLRLELKGPCPLASALANDDDRRSLEEAVAEGVGALWVEVKATGLARPIDLDRYRDSPNVLATALDLIARAKYDDALVDRLIPDVLAGLIDDDPERRRLYVRELLADMESDVAERLIAP